MRLFPLQSERPTIVSFLFQWLYLPVLVNLGEATSTLLPTENTLVPTSTNLITGTAAASSESCVFCLNAVQSKTSASLDENTATTSNPVLRDALTRNKIRGNLKTNLTAGTGSSVSYNGVSKAELNIRRSLDPSYFYHGEMQIRCYDERATFQIIEDLVLGTIPYNGLWGITQSEYESEISRYTLTPPPYKGAQPKLDMAKSRRMVRTLREICMNTCRCDPITGFIIANVKPGPSKLRKHRVDMCTTSVVAVKCHVFYNCHCEVMLGQPPAAGVTLDDGSPLLLSHYQDAINQIPAPIRRLQENREWTWAIDPNVPDSYLAPGPQLGFTVDLLGNPIEPENVALESLEYEPPLRLSGPSWRDPNNDPDPGSGRPPTGGYGLGFSGSSGSGRGYHPGAFSGFHKHRRDMGSHESEIEAAAHA
ncbi:hypothetical protein TWF730_009893 [Orbilia blumenaviensis]|uniref:Uncharacterized protein n=1 Tax=Orbilia blumenaviensis TaxID=1796055 RepID=A0AAV9UT73_9PEZI